MRGVFKLTLAAAGSLLLMTGAAFAQGVAPAEGMAPAVGKPNLTFSGNAGTSFGMFNYDKVTGASAPNANQKAFSEWETSYESNIRLTWTTDMFQEVVRYRFRGTSGGSGNPCGSPANSGGATCGAGYQAQTGAAPETDVYHESWWMPSAQFKLGVGKFQGQGWSQPMAGTYIIVNPLEVGNGGNTSEYWMNWTGIPGIDAEYNGGTWQAGVAISNLCRPSCNTGANQSTQTLVPHFVGKFGDISVQAQLPSTSGTIAGGTAGTTTAGGNTAGAGSATGTASVSGSGYQLDVAWAGMPGVRVALDLSSFTDAKNTNVTSQTSDRSKAGTALKVDFSGVTVAYFTIDDNNYTGTTGSSNMTTLRYTIPVGAFGAIIPEFRTTSMDGKNAGETTTGAPSQGAISFSPPVSRSNSEFRVIFNASL